MAGTDEDPSATGTQGKGDKAHTAELDRINAKLERLWSLESAGREADVEGREADSAN